MTIKNNNPFGHVVGNLLLFAVIIQIVLLRCIPTFSFSINGRPYPFFGPMSASSMLSMPPITATSKQQRARRKGSSLLKHHSKLQLNGEERHQLNSRRSLLQKTAASIITSTMTTTTTTGAVLTSNPQSAWCRNLPEGTGADLSSTGTITKLIPLLRMKLVLTNVQSELLQISSLSSQLEDISRTITKEIPNNEKQFKKLFDEYSVPVSYKQKYMDSNAFLIYYTNGFDGIGRDSIEKDLKEDSDSTISKQTLQYGARNDVWNAFDEFMVELQFITAEIKAGGGDGDGSVRDLLDLLNKVIRNLETYLLLAPSEDIKEALMQLNNGISR